MRKRLTAPLLVLGIVVLPLAGLAAGVVAGRYAGLPGGQFKSVLRYEDAKNGVRIKPFALMRKPVTNAEFQAFLKRHPEWRRDRVSSVFAEALSLPA